MKTSAYILLILAFFFSSCDKDENGRQLDENYNPIIQAKNFVDSVTNMYFPLKPGKIYTYRSQTQDGIETDVVSVLGDTKTILDIKCTVVHDVVSIDGQTIEDTYDWYAQDKDGNVWYMGEDVSNYEDGMLEDKEGSFETGMDGAKPGIIMHAYPVIEMPYRQEYYFNKAEDWGKVVAKNVKVTTTFGSFDNCIKTADWNALEPDAPIEYKYYAPNVGLVKEEIGDGSEYVDLISIE